MLSGNSVNKNFRSISQFIAHLHLCLTTEFFQSYSFKVIFARDVIVPGTLPDGINLGGGRSDSPLKGSFLQAFHNGQSIWICGRDVWPIS